jgi:hypothetical protein
MDRPVLRCVCATAERSVWQETRAILQITLFSGITRPEPHTRCANVCRTRLHETVPQKSLDHARYWAKTNGGPLTRFTLRFTVTSTRSAILMNGMLLFIP